jgi:protein-tyrosine phosphatase
MTADRVIAATGIHNLRDYGGYATAGGGRLKRGRLYRSGHHVAANEADLALIDALSLATVIDLRGDSERREWPCRRAPGFSARVLYADGETAGAGGAAHVVAGRDVRTAEDAGAAMRDLYAFMPRRPNLQAALRHYFAALAEDAGPSLVHCFAGKDRTGFAVALLHRLVGVHRDDAMADYLLTNTAGDSAARIAAGADALRRRRPEASDAAIERLMRVEPMFLDAAFATVEADWGGVTAYLDRALGLDEAAQACVRDRLTA